MEGGGNKQMMKRHLQNEHIFVNVIQIVKTKKHNSIYLDSSLFNAKLEESKHDAALWKKHSSPEIWKLETATDARLSNFLKSADR